LTPAVKNTLQTYFNDLTHCAATDSACLNALSLDAILEAQADTASEAIYLDAAAGNSQPIRPVRDGTLVVSSLNSVSSTYPSVDKPILITTVKNDAGSAIYGNFDFDVDHSLFELIVGGTFGTPRTDQVLQSSWYQLPSGTDGRVVLQTMGTDSLWKCAGWTFARNWVAKGGKAFTGVFNVGATYPSNDEIPYCKQNGNVCHEDDIRIVVCLFTFICPALF
jgi:hypothetical protein